MNVSVLGFDEAIATAATGDMWLFRGRSLADRAIQTMTNSPVNHVGMVVALEDMPPLMWHAELGKSLPDAWTGERQRGVQLHNLADAVRTWDEKYGQRAWMRRLEGGTLTREHEDRLIETIDKYDGKPFPTTPGPDALVGDRARPPPRGLARDDLLRRAGRGHVPEHGPAARQAPDELVRPGQVLVRRRDRVRRAVRAQRRDRGRPGLMTRQVGIGVIGLGWMGRVHAASYRRVPEHFPDLGVTPRLVVAADVSAPRRAHAARVGFERTVSDWRAVLEDPAVEAVWITLPNALHREVAVAAAQAGKHVWVEKPVGRGLADTEAVAAAVRAAGVISAVGFCYRFAPAVQHARALIEAGAIGTVTHYRGTFLADYASDPRTAASWRFRRADAGSGALGDLMAHSVDMTQLLVGPIARLSGRTAT